MIRVARVGFRLLAFFLASLVAVLLPLGATVLTLGARLPTARLGAVGTHLWCRMLCRVLGVTVKVRGRPPARTCLYAANHLGYLDVIVLGAIYKSQFLSMAEVAGWPFIGFLARRAGTLFIDRKRLRDVPRVRVEMAEYLARGISVTFFPEGKASPGLTVGAVRPSLLDVALGAGVAVVPVAISYETRGDPRPPSRTVCWWGDMDFPSHFVGLLSMTGIEATVAFGEALEADGDRKALAVALRERILAEFTPVRQG